MTRTTILAALHGYVNAWNAPDADARLGLLYQAVTDDVRDVHPYAPAPIEGRVGLVAFIDSVRARYPHRLQATAPPQHHHDVVRMPWHLATSETDVLATGLLVASTGPDGRLSWVAHFVDA